ncbi:MAG: 2-oxoglutarate dehydrogenase complex dihydrolipoyllysine-residue succinyltransferase [Acidiferrobacterales bacterium]
MSLEITVPVFPESIVDGTLVAWHKLAGEAVSRGDVLADIETDKIVFEIPAPVDGVLEEIFEQDGATVVSGQLLARLNDTQNKSQAKPVKKAGNKNGNDKKTTSKAKNKVVTKPAATVPIISPSAYKMMQENDLTDKQVAGSGKDGRILKEDVLRFLELKNTGAGKSVPATVSKPVGTSVTGASVNGRPEKRVAMSRLRARVAERLVAAQQTAAILTTFNEINMQPVMMLRKKYKAAFEKEHGVRLGFMSFFVKAVTEALRHYPEINASIDGKDIIYHGYFDIGIAVGSPRGLVVPILRNADIQTMAGIESQIVDYANKAKDGSLGIEEITGGTFTITNGGVFGSLLSTPILNPPQSAILGMHKIEDKPVVVEGEIVIRPMMYVALSYDHRIVDGQGAVQFLVHVKESLEDPDRLLLDI